MRINQFYVQNSAGGYLVDWDNGGEPEWTTDINKARGYRSHSQADDNCQEDGERVVRHPDWISDERVYQVVIYDQHTSRAGKIAVSFDPSDPDENRDDYLIIEGTRAELIEIARGYHGQITKNGGKDQFRDRVAESILAEIDGGLSDIYLKTGSLPVKQDLIEQFNKCGEVLDKAIASGARLPHKTFAEIVCSDFRYSFGMFHMHRPDVDDITDTHIDLIRQGCVQTFATDPTYGFLCGDVLHLSRILGVPLNTAFERFANQPN